MAIELDAVRDALLKRQAEYVANLDNVTGKQVRRQLESDMGLEAKTLDDLKGQIDDFIQELIIDVASSQGVKSPTPVKRAAKPSKKYADEDMGDEEDEDDEDFDSEEEAKKKKKGKAGKTAAPAKKGVAAKKAAPKKRKGRGGSDSEGDDSEVEEEDDDSEDDKPRKKSRAAAPREPAPARKYGARVEKLREICRQATIKIPPTVYRPKSDEGVAEALETLLAKYDLDARSSDADIKAAKKRLTRDRELDGIDTSNIIDEAEVTARGRPRRAAAAVTNYKAILKQLEDEEEEGEEGEGKEAATKKAGAKPKSRQADDDDIGGGDESEDDYEPGAKKGAKKGGKGGKGKKKGGDSDEDDDSEPASDESEEDSDFDGEDEDDE